ncbi:PWWP domain-containing protein 2B-like [Schistocerca americana]|uniref:PWWP domain-containing protein 2B-like n=1 Tax=Schistocerca americana TaxID=7009 RepID=UPI001F4F1CFD|nr:PWWP domain-containing protein 2B-like [Schistocerca americana]
MADTETISLSKILKNSKILVNVEEALQDILVVSFVYETKLYQGVLLDSTKKQLPCGINIPVSGSACDEDKLFSLSQRFTYFQEKATPPAAFHHVRRPVRPPARHKNSRMTVRLRPRQVLCSKCRSICNENSENVDLSGGKHSTGVGTERTGGDPPSRSPRPLFSENQRDNQPKVMTSAPSESPKQQFPPLVARLGEGNNKIKLGGYWVSSRPPSGNDKGNTEASSDGGGAMYCLSLMDRESSATIPPLPPPSLPLPPPPPPLPPPPPPPPPLSSASALSSAHPSDGDATDSNSDDSETDDTDARMVLRKKRSVGSMEDLWDESVFEDRLKRARTDAEKRVAAAAAVAAVAASAAVTVNTNAVVSNSTRTTPVIKISFGGSSGEGTVLKIPAKVQGYTAPSESETETDLVAKQESAGVCDSDSGECSRFVGSIVSTGQALGTKAARRALRKAKREARRKVLPQPPICTPGPENHSPQTACDATVTLYRRKHKHKVKHKKKHKEDRNRHNKDETAADNVGGMPGDDDRRQDNSYSAIKERCLKQKLSISLKRLNANAYTRCDYPAMDTDGSGAKSPAGSCTNSETSDDMTDFPPPGVGTVTSASSSQPLTMRISTHTVPSCLTSDGRKMAVGDVVWGKVHGFPWWPGKVLSITVARKDDGMSLAPQAHVAWYGSSTSSLMPCDQLSPFLETFKTRYNKKKRGPYKEAIRQATCEARREEQPMLAVTSSPREVNVVS